MTDQEKKAKLDALVASLAVELRPTVAKIEAGLQTTQHHYGDYGAILSRFEANGPAAVRVIALALVKAGANPLGVRAALKNFTNASID